LAIIIDAIESLSNCCYLQLWEMFFISEAQLLLEIIIVDLCHYYNEAFPKMKVNTLLADYKSLNFDKGAINKEAFSSLGRMALGIID
jgi:hypothetical protein